ncbi:MAG: polyprenyl synthetase family protein [Bacillota bacterium]|nr:polyprenyl synthetase family protein [Bacillota bacterium]
MTELEQIESALLSYLPSDNCTEKQLIESMKYSLMAGGKRIRPRLILEFCKLCGGDTEAAMPFACAIEMIHTYSLIHDDLPCMDDDDLRRGKPSNHKKFGEDIALLAGDALQSLAFSVMLSPKSVESVGADAAAKSAFVLAECCGANGMVGGQTIDLEYENQKASLKILNEMHQKKTGALINAACQIGCIIAGASKEKIQAAGKYAEKIGLAFQIIDDILDVTSDEETFGKPVGSDLQNNKSTFVTSIGIEKCRELASVLTKEAIDCLKEFQGDTEELINIANSLLIRKN